MGNKNLKFIGWGAKQVFQR